jgi:hypothetical protein
MSRRRERVEVDLPFIHVFVDDDGVRIGDDEGVIDMELDDTGEYRAVRRQVRKRLRFFRHAFTYVALNGLFVLVDWSTGGSGVGINWAQWVALIWGIFLAGEFVSTFVGPYLWGRQAEERMIQQELRKRHGG